MGSKFFRNEKQIELMNNRHPLKRTGRKEISQLYEFLLSEKSSWITGQDISIDGYVYCKSLMISFIWKYKFSLIFSYSYFCLKHLS